MGVEGSTVKYHGTCRDSFLSGSSSVLQIKVIFLNIWNVQKQFVSANIVGQGTRADGQTTAVLWEVKWEGNALKESLADWGRLHRK